MVKGLLGPSQEFSPNLSPPSFHHIKQCFIYQGRIHVWSELAPAPPFWRINHANSAYFRLFLGYFGVISATRPPFWISASPFYISWIRPCLHPGGIPKMIREVISPNQILTPSEFLLLVFVNPLNAPSVNETTPGAGVLSTNAYMERDMPCG